MIIGTLHPRHGARSYVWRPSGLETEAFARRRTDEESEAYMRSPIYYLRSRDEARLRRRLDTGEPLQFQLLDELRDLGMTEYAARIVRFGGVDTESFQERAARRPPPRLIRCRASSSPAHRRSGRISTTTS